ncbi:peptidase A4 family-domain-containing protein [Phanerochaete sordida]|uniref:Peptidase A4 family-domain-containing protein n=1 Tax=Phanerochaete sordida TaxID=48140 RepID=A0A9P3GSU5_9APHY|nr:peptidase A4 family-domain-containing protein [Phanerochaete sordida]
MYVSGTAVSFYGWHQWAPDASQDFGGIGFAPRDRVALTVSASTGAAAITNRSTGRSVRAALSSGAALCAQDAEWFLEDFSAGELVPFADFGTVRFAGARATDAAGARVGPADADTVVIVQEGRVVTGMRLGASSVVVKYIG